MFKATSKFGAQMDSLADIVNFGVAPALVLYAFLLDRAGSPGWIAALLFVIACGLGWRASTCSTKTSNRPAWQAEYFVGVPAPAGAVLVLLPVYLGFIGASRPNRAAGLCAAWSSPCWSPSCWSAGCRSIPARRRQRMSGDKVMPLILGLVFYVLLLISYPWQTLSASALAYLIFLPLSARAYSRGPSWRRRRRWQPRRRGTGASKPTR